MTLSNKFFKSIRKFCKNEKYAIIVEEGEHAICRENSIYLTIMVRVIRKRVIWKCKSKIVKGRKSIAQFLHKLTYIL